MLLYKSLFIKRFVLFVTALAMIGMYLVTRSQTSASNSLQSLQQQSQYLQNAIQQNQQQVSQNNNAIAGLASQIQNYQTLISQKEALISNEQQQINVLNAQIQQETIQINSLKIKINLNSKSNYEQTYVSPVTMFAGDPNINNALESVAYFNSTMSHIKILITKLDTTMNTLKQNKANADSLYASLVSQKQTLLQDQSSLQSEESSYTAQNGNLNSIISQNKSKEQQVLNEINALTISEYSGGAGCVSGNWWYYNQQCYRRLPGKNGTSINMLYGCLVTSIAMVATKEMGGVYTPPMIASMSSFSNDYMTSFPQFPNGYTLNQVGSGTSAINQALSQGLPAVVYLAAPAGQHWVVFYQSTGNNYLINDPWYGSGLSFHGTGGGTHEYYSYSDIGNVYVLN